MAYLYQADDTEMQCWWNSIKGNELWSGAIVDLTWDELTLDWQENLRRIYEDIKGDK